MSKLDIDAIENFYRARKSAHWVSGTLIADLISEIRRLRAELAEVKYPAEQFVQITRERAEAAYREEYREFGE